MIRDQAIKKIHILLTTPKKRHTVQLISHNFYK